MRYNKNKQNNLWNYIPTELSWILFSYQKHLVRGMMCIDNNWCSFFLGQSKHLQLYKQDAGDEVILITIKR